MNTLKKNLLAGALYFLGAYVGLLLGLPPSNASPFWPPAGIALAMLLICNYSVLPGLVAGAFAAQLYSFLDTSTFQSILISAGTGFVIGFGSILQAATGKYLVDKYVGINNPLLEDRTILRFFMLGGPVSCCIAATIGTTMILLINIIKPADYLLTWLTWWVGDTIGVLVLTPMLMIFFAEPRQLWQQRKKSVFYPLLLILALMMALFQYGKYQDIQRMKFEFDDRISEFHTHLEEHLNDNIHSSQELVALYTSMKKLFTETEFTEFTNYQLAQQKKLVRAIEWIPLVRHGERDAFENNWLGPGSISEPDPDGRMVPAQHKDEYYPIRYVNPVLGNERAIGFDISFNPVALSALVRARDKGDTSMTAPITLVQDNERKKGTVLYTPIYTGFNIPESVDERRETLLGLIAVVFLAEDIVRATLEILGEFPVNLSITDGTQPVYNRTLDAERHDLELINLTREIQLQLADRVWKFTYSPSLEYFKNYLYWFTWWLLLIGMFITAMAGTGLLMLTGRTLQTEFLVKRRTSELQNEILKTELLTRDRQKQNEILNKIASTMSFQDMLEFIVRIYEETYPGSICTILLLEKDNRTIRHGAAPGLPEYYNKAIDGLEIGAEVGSCGSAMFRREAVIVEDIETHPYWENFRELARQAGIKSCWSQPILSNIDGRVLGSFAIYYSEKKSPTEEEIEKIDDYIKLTCLAIERNEWDARIQHLAYFDALTDLPNRRMILQRLEQEIASTRRSRNFGALLFIDLDQFKNLNDSMGHDMGDQLLIQASKRIKKCIREEDIAGRLGGDEFLVILRSYEQTELGKTSEYAYVLAQRIKNEINEPFDLDGFIYHVTPSIGITFFPGKGEYPEDYMKQADAAMYAAKHDGRNCIRFFEPEMQERATNRLTLEKELREALLHQQFRVLYQPQFDTEERVIGAEALLRWEHPEKGMISPDHFMDIAEETNLIFSIGDWVIAEVCKQMVSWRHLDHISVNISPIQLKNTEFVTNLEKYINQYSIGSNKLMLEVTENIFIGNLNDTLACIEKLRDLEVLISIDDFGTGYSSLSYLKNLPLNQLKIDQGFVRDIAIDENDKIIVETIISMAGHFKLDVIAEGVETLEQKEYLMEMGCRLFQGFYFSTPLAVDEFNRKYNSGKLKDSVKR